MTETKSTPILAEVFEEQSKTGLPIVVKNTPGPSSEIDLQALTYYLGGELERRPFELNLFSGDIRDADCRAYAFGIYELSLIHI